MRYHHVPLPGVFFCQCFQAYTSLLPSSMNPTPYFQPNCPCHHEPQPCKYTHADNHPPANRECLSHLVFGQFPLMRMIIPMPVLCCVAATSRTSQRRAPRRGEDGGGCPAVDNEERKDEGQEEDGSENCTRDEGFTKFTVGCRRMRGRRRGGGFG
jgi:hypothetical protein